MITRQKTKTNIVLLISFLAAFATGLEVKAVNWNFIQNGSFDGWSRGLPIGWTEWGGSVGTVSQGEGRLEGSSLKLVGGRTVVYQNFEVEPNTDYKLTFWAKSEGLTGDWSPYGSLGASDNPLEPRKNFLNQYITESQGWTKYEHKFNSESYTPIGVGIQLSGGDDSNILWIDDVQLVEDGDLSDAYATILLPAGPIESEVFAARELAEYLGKITGECFDFATQNEDISGERIILGSGVLSESVLGEESIGQLGNEDFIIRSIGSDLFLVGGGPRGTLFAVYDFLEYDLGCIWFNEHGEEFVPRLTKKEFEDIAAGINRKETPAFLIRDAWPERQPRDLSRSAKEYLLKNWRISGPTSNRFYPDRLRRSEFLSTLRFPAPIVHATGPFAESWKHLIYFPEEKYLEKHPEFYAQRGGEIDTRFLCWSNQEMRQALTRKVLDRIEGWLPLDPGKTYILDLSITDSPGVCQCPECQEIAQLEGTPGAAHFEAIADIASVVKEKYSNLIITTLAYRLGQTEIPPKNIQFPNNVWIRFSPVDRSLAYPLEHPVNDVHFQNVLAWAEKNVTLLNWSWALPHHGFAAALPIGVLTRYKKDFQLYQRLGFKGWNLYQWFPLQPLNSLAELQRWVVAQYMWRPNQDIRFLIRRYTKYYGEAAEYIEEVLWLLEQATLYADLTFKYRLSELSYRHFLTPAFLKKVQNIFDAAEEKVATDPVSLLRVRQVRMSFDRATIFFWKNFSDGQQASLNREEIADRYSDTWKKTAEQRGYNKTIVDDWLNLQEQLLDIKPLPAPLDQVPAERVRQVTVVQGSRHGAVTRVEDPEAAIGLALTDPRSELPFTLGYYCQENRIIVKRTEIGREQIVSAGYNLYKLGRITIPSDTGIVWISRSWHIQIPLAAGVYDMTMSNQEWDVYVSMRFEGPGYPQGHRGDEDRIYVDRVIYVRVEDK